MSSDQDALLEKLYRSYFRLLVVHAYRTLGNWDDANFAAQEAFHVACEKIDQLADSENQIGWLKNTVRNVCHHMIRERNQQALLFSSLDELTDAEMPVTSDDIDAQSMDILEELVSKDEIGLLKKIILDGIPYSQAAAELGCNVWACRKRIQRSIDKIRQKYREKFGEDFSL
ncbi:sigma-70 family RNA polymerase sigma factor [Oscillospiraceae bacterium 38-13]